MRRTLSLLALMGLFVLLCTTSDSLRGQEKKAEPEPKKEKLDAKKEEKDKKQEEVAPLVEFDQGKADLETLKQGNLKNEPEAILNFFKSRSVGDEQRKKIEALIAQFGSEEFDKRELACDEIVTYGVAAVGLLRQAERGTDVEVSLRCQRCLGFIEKVSTGALSQAAARQLARLKPDGTAEVMLNFLPFIDDESLGEEVRSALAEVAVKSGTPNAALLKALDDSNDIRRGAAAEALARGGDKSIRARMKEFLTKEPNLEAKLLITLSLVNYGKEKPLVPEMIKLLSEVPSGKLYRAEEILYTLAGDTPPTLPTGSDDDSRKKYRDAWMEWWTKNEAKIDLAKLDDREKLLGFTLMMEMDVRGVGGRIIEVGPDGKERWKIVNLQFPSDAIVLPGNHVIVAEHNSNRVTERDMAGKEFWAIPFNQPVNVQKLASGNTFIVGRSGIGEFDRNQKQVFTFNRPEYDIVSGRKTRTGETLFLTQRGQIIRLDKDGKQLKIYNVGRVPYWAGLELLPNGKVLYTQINGVAELDLNSGESVQLVTYNANPSSCQKLPNGNILVCGMNRMHVVELDRNSKQVWEYKSNEANYRPWRSTRR